MRIPPGAEATRLQAIGNDAKEGSAGTAERLARALRHLAAISPYTAHHDHPVDLTQQGEGIGNDGKGRRIDDDKVIA